MTILEDGLRAALHAEAQSLQVPERPALDRDTVELRRRPGFRWVAAAACLALVVTGVVALAARHAEETEPAPPADTVAPATTAAETTGTVATETFPTVTPSTSAGPVDVAPEQFVGTWVKFDSLGLVSTMTVEVAGDGIVELAVTDFVQVCAGGPSTMIGTGRVQAGVGLVFPAPELTCDDGSQPEGLTISPLDEDLQDLTFTRDPPTDILTDNFGGIWTREGATSAIDPASPPSEETVNELVNGFLDARLAGDGAQQFLNGPANDIPLLYSTTSGARFERAEFERGPDLEWPYGFTPFTVRLFAGATVVEQIFFTPATGRLGLEFQPDGFGTDTAATTEDGQPVAVPYEFLDGQVSLQVAHPWMFNGNFARLIPEGPVVQPTTDGGQRNDWDELFLIADPAPITTGCPTGSNPVDAAALADSIRSNTGLESTAPAPFRAGALDGLMIDVTIAAGTPICATEAFGGDLLDLVFDRNGPFSSSNGLMTGNATGESMRLYLFDAPEGASMQILAVAVVAPESSFDRAVQAAAPIIASLEFHSP